MNLSKQIIVLSLESDLIIKGEVSTTDQCHRFDISRQNLSPYFKKWQDVSDLPFYDRSSKKWLRNKGVKSELFKELCDAEQYMLSIDFVIGMSKKIRECITLQITDHYDGDSDLVDLYVKLSKKIDAKNLHFDNKAKITTEAAIYLFSYDYKKLESIKKTLTGNYHVIIGDSDVFGYDINKPDSCLVI